MTDTPGQGRLADELIVMEEKKQLINKTIALEIPFIASMCHTKSSQIAEGVPGIRSYFQKIRVDEDKEETETFKYYKPIIGTFLCT